MQDMLVDLMAKIVRDVAEGCFPSFRPTPGGYQRGWRDVTTDLNNKVNDFKKEDNPFKNEGVED
jgi:hypothetical protein